MLTTLLLFIVSLIANTLSSLAGGGAGLLQLPILIFLGLPFTTALVTHKIASIALGMGATIKHLKSGKLNLRFCVFILAAGLPGVVSGAWIVLRIPEFYANLGLAVLTISLGIYSIFKPTLGQTEDKKHRHFWGYFIGGIGLFIIGALNGSLTSGTGLFVTILLIRWFGLDYKQAVAYTLVLVGLFWNGTGAIALALNTPVYWPWVPVLLVASFIGGYLGAHLSQTKGNRLIKRVFEVVTIATGLSLILKTLF